MEMDHVLAFLNSSCIHAASRSAPFGQVTTSAWKCSGACSRQNICMTIPKNWPIVGVKHIFYRR